MVSREDGLKNRYNSSVLNKEAVKTKFQLQATFHFRAAINNMCDDCMTQMWFNWQGGHYRLSDGED